MKQLLKDMTNKVEDDTLRSIRNAADLLTLEGEPPTETMWLMSELAYRLLVRVYAAAYAVTQSDDLHREGVQALFADLADVLSLDSIQAVVSRRKAEFSQAAN